MSRYLVFIVTICGVLFSVSCSSNQPVANANAPKNASAANTNSANNSTAAKVELYSSVYAMKGNRMPDDAKLVEQKRDFRNALHINIKKPAEGLSAMNWEEKFKDPVNLKLDAGESVMVITFASAEGKKLEKGVFEATEAADAVENSAKDKPFAIITLIDSTGVKRLKGKVKVTDVGDIIMYSFDEKPNAPGLDSMSYGAPFKN